MNDNRTHAATGKACPQALEFFAGIGLARLGLEESGFQVEWSNDIDSAKCEMYRNNFTDTPGHTLVEGDMSELSGDDLPHDASIAWGSSPCTDLSLAGTRTGLNGKQSGAFWQYVRLLEELGDSRPPIAILENVNGLATSHSGEDLAAAVHAFNVLGYSVDVLSIDTRRFIPQSRPRLFLVGLQNPPSAEQFDSSLRPDWLQQVFADTSLRTHRAPLPEPPSPLMSGLNMYVENMADDDERWWDEPPNSLIRCRRFRLPAWKRCVTKQPFPTGPLIAAPATAKPYGKFAQTTSPAACAPHEAAHLARQSFVWAMVKPLSVG